MKKKALNPTHDFVNMPMVHTHAAAIDVPPILQITTKYIYLK